MAEKKNKSLEEDVLRYIYNSRFYPDDVVNDDGPAFLFDNGLMDLIANAKSYDEARNILVGALDDEKNVQLARDATRDYLESFGDDNNTYDWEKSFGSKLVRVPINVDALPYEIVENRANNFAKAIGFSDIRGLINKMNENTVMGDWGQFGLSDGFKQKLRDEMSEKLKNGTLTRQTIEKILDYSPNADDDYIINKALEYADRVKRKESRANMGEISKSVNEFLFPYQAEKEKEGIKPTPFDALVDLATFVPTAVGGARYGKGKNGGNAMERLVTSMAGKDAGKKILAYTKLAGLGVAGGVMEPFFTRANDAADALLRKKVYANEGSSDEIYEKDNLIDALKLESLISDIGTGISNNIGSSAAGLMGRAGSKVIGNLINKAAQTKAGKFVKNGFDALFGSKNDAVNYERKLRKEKKAIQEEINSFGRPNSSVTTEDLVMNRNRLNDIAREEEELRKRFVESAANKAQTAIDALLGGYVIKSGLNPDRNAKQAIKNAYLVDFYGL